MVSGRSPFLEVPFFRFLRMATFSFEPKKVRLKHFWSERPRHDPASVPLLGHTPGRLREHCGRVETGNLGIFDFRLFYTQKAVGSSPTSPMFEKGLTD